MILFFADILSRFNITLFLIFWNIHINIPFKYMDI